MDGGYMLNLMKLQTKVTCLSRGYNYLDCGKVAWIRFMFSSKVNPVWFYGMKSQGRCPVDQLPLKAVESMLNKSWLRRLFIELVILARDGADI
jgi:hypothetical protein